MHRVLLRLSLPVTPLPSRFDLKELNIALKSGHHCLGAADKADVGHADAGEIVIQALRKTYIKLMMG